METKTQLPEFKGKSLIEIPKYIPQADILRGEFGRAVLEEYNGRVKSDFNDNSNLHVLKYTEEKDIVTGSSSFAVSLANQIITEQNPSLRTATQADLETILKLDVFNFQGTYEDTALVLRNKEEPNSYLARDLIKQLGNIELPVMIPLDGLTLRVDADSPYGLAFNCTDYTEKIHAPILNENSGNFSSKDIDEKTGLPKNLGEGNRYFYTRNSGLSRLYLYRDLGAYASGGDLADSNDVGRVVVVNAVGAQKNLEEAEKQKAEIDERFKEAMSVLIRKK